MGKAMAKDSQRGGLATIFLQRHCEDADWSFKNREHRKKWRG